MIDKILENWAIVGFCLGIIWANIKMFFDIREIKKKVNEFDLELTRNEARIEHIQKEIRHDIKELMIENKESLKELSKHTAELNITTKVLAEQIKWIKEGKQKS
jgi:hypothetical protein